MARLKQSDAETLAARMAKSEHLAFQEFAKTFGPRLRAYFMHRGLRAADADDLAVSSVTDICLRVEKYERREGGSFEAWVFTLAKRFLSDWRKKHPEFRPLQEGAESDEPVTQKSPQQQAALHAVTEGYEQLSETDQLILRLRHFEEVRTFAEIGEILGIKEGTARVRHKRAIENLKAVLTNDSRIAHILKKTTSEAIEGK